MSTDGDSTLSNTIDKLVPVTSDGKRRHPNHLDGRHHDNDAV